MNLHATPENYGYKIGENIAPYINKCIDDHGECYIGDGTHVVGISGDNITENVWSENGILWGWTRKDNVKIIGNGIDKTILKFADNCQPSYLDNLTGITMPMLHTNWSVDCNNNLIEGITFDGNYDNNNKITSIGIRIRGENNTIRNCKFTNFGVGNNQINECFTIIIYPINKDGIGQNIENNTFTSMGRKINSTINHVPEITCVSVGGKKCTVISNLFKNIFFDKHSQQSPIHGISLAESKNSIIKNNMFVNFQGTCFYFDSWANEDYIIEKNDAKNVWKFLHLSSQYWENNNQISLNKNINVFDNNIELSNDDCYFHWNKPTSVSGFVTYVNDPLVDRKKHIGFENIKIYNNKIKLGFRKNNNLYEQSTILTCLNGPTVSEIRMVNNDVVSSMPTLPIVKKQSLFKKILTWFKKLFGL